MLSTDGISLGWLIIRVRGDLAIPQLEFIAVSHMTVGID